MVSSLSRADKNAITEAIKTAERQTVAELVAVVAPASDGYQGFLTLYGLFIGSMAALYLWQSRIAPDFPVLLAVQVAAITLLTFIPFLRHLCLRFVPMHIQHQRAGRRAGEEYLMVTRHVSPEIPVVLLYISERERYAHIQHSRAVQEKIPQDAWQAIVNDLTAQARVKGVGHACVTAVTRMGELLAAHFPQQGPQHGHLPDLIEIQAEPAQR